MKVTITVCNVCQDGDKPTQAYEIRREGEKWPLDLCKDDAAPLEPLIRAAAPSRRGRGTGVPNRSGGGRRPRVTTMDEIDALKG